ncbi:DoxX family protein [Candidatus Uhrbacteria bacterium]|nr:DoxX family protein [Candidatus Uhrbacteria bacterium]
MQTLFLIGQIVLGVYFIKAGLHHFTQLEGMAGYAASKHVPAPKLAVGVTGLMLLLGGVGVLFQFQLVWAYGLLIAFLVLAAFTMHRFWVEQDPNMKMANQVNFQKNLALAAALLMLLWLQA